MHVIAPSQASGGSGDLVLPEIIDPDGSEIPLGTVFIARTTVVPPAFTEPGTLMAFLGGFPAILGVEMVADFTYALQIKTSGGLKTITAL